jgi:hypothetical protein
MISTTLQHNARTLMTLLALAVPAAARTQVPAGASSMPVSSGPAVGTDAPDFALPSVAAGGVVLHRLAAESECPSMSDSMRRCSCTTT